MRPFLAAAVAIAILGGLQFYMSSRPAPVNNQRPPEVLADGKFDVRLTLTFDAGPDPFAFDSSQAASVVVLFEGKDLLRLTEHVNAGADLVVEDVASIDAGRNEFFVEAVPKDTTNLISRGIRIQVFRDGVMVGDQSLWSDPGAPVAGTIVVDVPTVSGAVNDDVAAEPSEDGAP